MSNVKQSEKQSRKWLITINNPEEHNVTLESIRSSVEAIPSVGYWCMCRETGGGNGTPHIHVFIYRRSAIRFDILKRLFPSAHIDHCKGTCAENRDYILKQGKYADSEKNATNHPDTFEESGLFPDEQQGKRNDVATLVNLIKDGVSTAELIEFNPNYARYYGMIDKTRQVLKAEEYKNRFRELVVEYWYGETGTGKTRTVMSQYGYNKVCHVTNYAHPFDHYEGQDVLILDEFRSDLRIGELLQLLDGYPLHLPCRYHDKVACFTKVYVISNIPLSDQYPNIQKEQRATWEALLRRINTVKHFGINGVDKVGTPRDFLHDYADKYDDGFTSVEDTDISDDNPFR